MRILGILLILLPTMARAPTAVAAPRVLVLDLDDTIQPASLRYVERGLRRADAEHAALVVIELDTPGGLLESLRSMTSAIVSSPVPVVVYVTPSGARGASAGFFLLLAADVAAMAPGTNAGAAHPVALGDFPDDKQDDKDKSDDQGNARTPLDKAAKDAAALARALAERRHRSVEASQRAVLESASFTAEEALAQRLIDLIAIDRAALLNTLDGRSITRFDGTVQTLRLADAEVVPLERTLAERVLTVIASPQVAYMLLMLGALGLMIELMSPGLGVPGIAGGLALLLGIYGFSILPVSVTAALLLAAGLALLVAEVFVTSYGLLAVAGISGVVAGSLMLVDSPIPELQIGPEVVVPIAVVLAAVTSVLAIRAVRSRRLRARSGVEMMLGERARVVAPIDTDHEGKVFVHGEYWTATSEEYVPEGATVRVDAIDGLRLHVTPTAHSASQGGTP